jgi:hypothetical protein
MGAHKARPYVPQFAFIRAMSDVASLGTRATSPFCFRVYEPEIQSALIRVISGKVISSVASVASCKIQYRFGCGSAAPGQPRPRGLRMEGSSEYSLAGWTKVSPPAYFARLT